MSSPTRTGRLVLRTTALVLSSLFLSPAIYPAAADWTSRVTPRLLAVWAQAHSEEKIESLNPGVPAGKPLPPARFDPQGRVQLDVRYECSAPAPTLALSAAGFVVGASVHIPPLCVVEGWLPANQLPELASLDSVANIDLPRYSSIIKPVMRPMTLSQSPPSTVIDGSALASANVSQYIETTGKNGAGVTIGVMSDDVASLALIQARGELPAHVAVLTPSGNPSPGASLTDEGTMMLEEMYAIAPGAKLMFCGPGTDVEYANCLQQLIAAGASIVADDIEYPAEDLFSAESSLAQSVQTLLTQNPNVALFSAAGNENLSYWQGQYAPIHLPRSYSCGGQTDYYGQSFSGSPYETLNLSQTLAAPIYLQWADPFGANVSDFDLYVLDHNLNVVECIPGAQSSEVFDGDLSPQFPAGTYQIVIATPNGQFSGKPLKLIVYGDGAARFSDPSPGSVASPQKLLAAVATVGAVDGDGSVGTTIENYSATGPVQLEFPTAATLQAPVVVALDGVYVDAGGTRFAEGPSGLFWGTSAATPNAAAVAALLRGTFPTLNAVRIVGAIKSGAAQLDVAVPDGIVGYGRVDALGALQALPKPAISVPANIAITGGSASQVAVTLSGTGKLSLSGSSDNATLVSLAGSAWYAPTSCGVATNSCTLTITPAVGQLGVAHLHLSVSDGAARSASASATVTVTTPAPPTVRISSGGSQSVAAGAAPQAVSLSLSGARQLTISITSSNATLLPASSATLSAGCGASSFSCTMNLKPAAGQSGTATLTVSARDPYGQSAQSTVSLSVAVAAKSSGGGGGALDCGSELLLGLLILWRHARRGARAGLVPRALLIGI